MVSLGKSTPPTIGNKPEATAPHTNTNPILIKTHIWSFSYYLGMNTKQTAENEDENQHKPAHFKAIARVILL